MVLNGLGSVWLGTMASQDMGGDDWMPTVETFELIGTAPTDEEEARREMRREATMVQYEKVKAKYEDASAEFRILEDMERNGSKGVPFAVAVKGPARSTTIPTWSRVFRLRSAPRTCRCRS